MGKKSQLKRTCLACGLEKPLAAFLQLSGSQGTVYGNLCSTCRSEGAKTKIIVPVINETDDSQSGGGSSGLRIDANAKIQQEIDQKKFDKEKKVANVEEVKKKEKGVFEKLERKETKEQAEKYHRISFIDAKQNQGFLGKKPVTSTPNQQTPPEKSFIEKHEQTLEHQKLETQRDAEFKQTSSDFSSGVSIDPGTAGIRFQSGTGQQYFESILGKSALINRIKQLYGAKNQEPTTTPSNKENQEVEKDPLIDYAKDNLKSTPPRGGRRR